MEESDKTTALKKAYAEIILNTTKEAATRVMVSDRKSARFQHDLCGTKDEALRLLVRLKQMIAAKTIEADIISSNQQRQIDVLEAQLQEAEEIITDLRSELRWVRDKMEKAAVYESQERDVLNEDEETISLRNVSPEVVRNLKPNQEVADTCFSVMTDALPDRSSFHEVECENDEKHFDGLSVNTLKGKDACESELDADIKIKKLELSRNGCTQRIHALERNVLERKSSSSGNEEEQYTTKKDSEENLSSGKVNEHEAGSLGNTRCLVLALRASNGEVITKLSNALGIKKTGKARKLRGRRKRRCGKQKATSVRSQSQRIKPCQSESNLPCSKTSMKNSDGEDSMETSEEVDAINTITCKGLEEHLQLKRTLYSGDISIIRKGKRSKNMENPGGIFYPAKPTHHLVEACRESSLVSINAEDGEDKAYIPANETKIKPLTRLGHGLTSIKSNADPTSGSTNVTIVSVTATNRSTDKELISSKKDLLVKCEAQEDCEGPTIKIGSELVNRQSDSKVTAVVPDQTSESPRADANRLVKYTFQRKRKRGSSNEIDESNNLPGEREAKEKENNAQDPIESTLTSEPSRGTPQLAEVATQRKSLFESRWYTG